MAIINNMSSNYEIVSSVLNKAVKYNITPEDVADLVNNIINSIEWDNDPCNSKYVIICANYLIKDDIVDKQSYIDWVNKYSHDETH
jgi:hypothetical protein